MTVLSLTKPFDTDVPFLLVENKLKVGTHAFRLVVVDDDGTESEPMDAVVQVRDPTTLIIPPQIVAPGPTRPIDPIGPVIRPVNPVLKPAVQPVVKPVLTSPVKPAVKPAAPITPTIPPRGKGKPK